MLELKIPGKKITKNEHKYTTNESILLYILKLGGPVHSCQFETISFAISQPLCIMYMGSIYYLIYLIKISHVSCI